jgi:hypothetical protein
MPIQMKTGSCPPLNITPPADVTVKTAEYGDVITIQQSWNNGYHTNSELERRDPFVLFLDGLEPGATLEVLRMNDPQVSWEMSPRQIRKWPIPLQPMQVAQLTLSNDVAQEKLGLFPGDIFELRQRDAEGNVSSEPTRVILQNDGSDSSFEVEPSTSIGEIELQQPNLEPGVSCWLQLVRYQDSTPPIYHEEAMTLETTDDGALFRGEAAVERHGAISLQNLASREVFETEVDPEGNFELPVKLGPGDPFQITVRDHSGNATPLEPDRFLPVCSSDKNAAV